MRFGDIFRKASVEFLIEMGPTCIQMTNIILQFFFTILILKILQFLRNFKILTTFFAPCENFKLQIRLVLRLDL